MVERLLWFIVNNNGKIVESGHITVNKLANWIGDESSGFFPEELSGKQTTNSSFLPQGEELAPPFAVPSNPEDYKL